MSQYDCKMSEDLSLVLRTFYYYIYYPNRTFPPIPAVLPFSVAAKAPVFVQTLLEKTLHQFDIAYFGGEKIEYLGLPDVVYRLDVSIR